MCTHDRKISSKNWLINQDFTLTKVIAILNLLKCLTFHKTFYSKLRGDLNVGFSAARMSGNTYYVGGWLQGFITSLK